MSSTKVSQSTLIVSTITALYLFTSGSNILSGEAGGTESGSDSTRRSPSVSLLVSAASVSKATTHSSPIVVSNWWIFFLAAIIGLTLSLCLVLTICTCRSFCSSFTSCDTEVCSEDESDSMICFSQSQQHNNQQNSAQEHSVPISGSGGALSAATGQLTQIFIGNNSGNSNNQTSEEKQCLLTAEGGGKGRKIIALRTAVVES